MVVVRGEPAVWELAPVEASRILQSLALPFSVSSSYRYYDKLSNIQR